MVSKTECERAVDRGADWYCVWCDEFYSEDDVEIVTDHHRSYSEPFCNRCDADVVPARHAHMVD